MSAKRHITLPAGFLAAGVQCGIKASGKHDLAIISAIRDAPAAIVTTRNQVVGAPILWCRDVLPKGYGKVRGIVINAGCSNVCTGKAGLRDAKDMAAQTAGELGVEPEKVLVASTGVIGQRLEMDKIRAGISDATGRLGTGNDRDALRAIMTTDLAEKSAVVRTRIGRGPVTLAGMVKGSGMIAPSMATMIAVITTDAAVTPAALGKALPAAVERTFNAITVDSDTSTSDMVAVLASGMAGNDPVTVGSKHFGKFQNALTELCDRLARAVVADGEGATKLIEVAVTGARSGAEAEVAAKAVANSPLFKCAMHGGDPNWGRIAAALGKSAAKVDPERLTIKIGGVTIFSRGSGRQFDGRKVAAHLRGKQIHVACNLSQGKGKYTALTCDLSREYITINADYHT